MSIKLNNQRGRNDERMGSVDRNISNVGFYRMVLDFIQIASTGGVIDE